ncbi:cupin domain-containing protein [Pseudoramibacter faecis]|uniref:cupin domain-containing protein n=1 Tax=Pseudoramibacter faecis TaxID=3108534 RepID=UPI002E77A06D|nr:cupin domain-containing protein [Pseudoramibacter sp. HA2172]
MGKLEGLDKRAFVTHLDDVPWQEVGDGFRIKKLLSENHYDKSEFYIGVAELDPGKDIPVQKANLACCTHILEGEVWARLGRQRFQLEKSASNYFPAGLPHAYEHSGDRGVRFLFCYATDNDIGEKDLKIEPVDEQTARDYYQPNCPSNLMSPGAEATGCRWATAGDTDPWVIVEAAQGMRSQRFQAHFDEVKGCQEMWWGLCRTRPNCRYTPHYHEQAEIFYITEGCGVMYGGTEVHKVKSGTLLYAPSGCVHGMVVDDNKELFAIYCCSIERVGTAYERIEVADVPIIAPVDRDEMMLSKV